MVATMQEDLARQIAEAGAIARAASAEADAREAEAREEIASHAFSTDEAERKAERDRRYAARKAKQR